MSRVAQKRTAKVEAIYDVAGELFAERGFAATRMEDIAAGLGMQKASLYYYFDSKETLLTSLVQSRVGIALDAIRDIVEQEESATSRVRGGVNRHLSVFQDHSDVYTIYNSERLHSISRETAQTVDSLGREYEQLWGRLFREGMQQGEFRGDLDVSITVKALLGSCNATLSWFQPDGRYTIEQVADRFSEIFLNGVSV